ncbi:MAG: hypothetical protein J0I08_15525 [Rhizobiales bacterium]|nr:hypothetical protein [Hyphomicrobiales bacterium]
MTNWPHVTNKPRKARAYEGYAKRTEKRALAATRKRYVHRLASMTDEEAQTAAESAAHSEVPANALINQ